MIAKAGVCIFVYINVHLSRKEWKKALLNVMVDNVFSFLLCQLSEGQT